MKCQDRVFPSWNRRGGCASKKKARSLRSGADGVVIMVHVDLETLSGTDHPVCAFIRRLRSIFLMAQPPLLSEEGNTLSCNSLLCGSPLFVQSPVRRSCDRVLQLGPCPDSLKEREPRDWNG